MSEQYEVLTRDQVEVFVRAAIKYGWMMGLFGSTLPDVMFDWADGYPKIVAAIVEADTP